MSAFELPLEHEELFKPLGEPIAEFRTGYVQIAALWLFTVGAFVVGLGLLAFVLGAVLWFDLKANFHMATLVKVGLFGLVLLSVGVRGVLRIRKTRGIRVFAFAQGLGRIQGESAEMLRWEDVTVVQRVSLTSSERSKMQPSRKLILLANDGRTFELDDSLHGLHELRDLVEQQTLTHLFPPLLDLWEAGEDVSFGKLSATRDGLRFGDKTLPWAACEDIEVTGGQVTVKAQGAWLSFCKVPLHEVPNVHILLALAEYIRKYAG